MCGTLVPDREERDVASSTSFRISDTARTRLAARAAREGTSATALLDQLIVEGIDQIDYPGIVFRGPARDRGCDLAPDPVVEGARGDAGAAQRDGRAVPAEGVAGPDEALQLLGVLRPDVEDEVVVVEGLALLAATRIATGETTTFFRLSGNAESGIDMGWSLALVGAG